MLTRSVFRVELYLRYNTHILSSCESPRCPENKVYYLIFSIFSSQSQIRLCCRPPIPMQALRDSKFAAGIEPTSPVFCLSILTCCSSQHYQITLLQSLGLYYSLPACDLLTPHRSTKIPSFHSFNGGLFIS